MSLIDMDGNNPFAKRNGRYGLATDWFSNLTDVKIKIMHKQGNNVQDVYDYVGTFFDAHVSAHRARFVDIPPVCVPVNCPNDWPPVLASVWEAVGRDDDEAAMFLGCLYCRVAISRENEWWMSAHMHMKGRADPHKWMPRKYEFAPHLRLPH